MSFLRNMGQRAINSIRDPAGTITRFARSPLGVITTATLMGMGGSATKTLEVIAGIQLFSRGGLSNGSSTRGGKTQTTISCGTPPEP